MKNYIISLFYWFIIIIIICCVCFFPFFFWMNMEMKGFLMFRTDGLDGVRETNISVHLFVTLILMGPIREDSLLNDVKKLPFWGEPWFEALWWIFHQNSDVRESHHIAGLYFNHISEAFHQNGGNSTFYLDFLSKSTSGFALQRHLLTRHPFSNAFPSHFTCSRYNFVCFVKWFIN